MKALLIGTVEWNLARGHSFYVKVAGRSVITVFRGNGTGFVSDLDGLPLFNEEDLVLERRQIKKRDLVVVDYEANKQRPMWGLLEEYQEACEIYHGYKKLTTGDRIYLGKGSAGYWSLAYPLQRSGDGVGYDLEGLEFERILEQKFQSVTDPRIILSIA